MNLRRLSQNPTAWRLLLGAAAFALLGIGAFVVTDAVRGKAEAKAGARADLDSLMRSVDEALGLGYRERALSLLSKAVDLAHGERELLRILKRAYPGGTAVPDRLAFASLAERCRKKAPASAKLQKLFLYASLRAGNLNPLKASPPRSLMDRRLSPLAAEAILRGASIDLDPKTLFSPQRYPLISGSRDPEAYERQGKQLGDKDLILDAALLWMQRGGTGRALKITLESLGETCYDEPSAFIAYDSGNWNEALKRTVRIAPGRPDLSLLAGDLLWLLNRHEEAEHYYIKAIDLDPDFSWQPYLNLALIYTEKREPDSASLFLERAYQLFSKERVVAVRYADFLKGRGHINRSLDIVQKILQLHPNDEEASLLRLDLEETSYNPKRYLAALWTLYQNYPSSASLAERLTVYLMEIGDSAGALMALGIFDRESGLGSSPRLVHLQGILLALQGDLEGARSHLQRSLELEEDWQTWYDLALLSKLQGRQVEAIEALQKSESILLHGSGQRPPAPSLSAVRTLRAECYESLSDAPAARKEYAGAVELDPENLRARLGLRKLEEARKK